MIKINRDNDITLISAAVTDFADCLGYCEYKIPLSIQGVKPKPSQALISGTKAHHVVKNTTLIWQGLTWKFIIKNMMLKTWQ